jgi:hypothetical protein
LFQGSEVVSGSMAAPSPAAASSRGGADPSSATPSTQASSPHEARDTDITSGVNEV